MKLVVVWDQHGAGSLVGVFKEGDKHLNELRKKAASDPMIGNYMLFSDTKLNHQLRKV